LTDAGGLHLQVIAYRPDSPDLGAPAETVDGTTEEDL